MIELAETSESETWRELIELKSAVLRAYSLLKSERDHEAFAIIANVIGEDIDDGANWEVERELLRSKLADFEPYFDACSPARACLDTGRCFVHSNDSELLDEVERLRLENSVLRGDYCHEITKPKPKRISKRR